MIDKFKAILTSDEAYKTSSFILLVFWSIFVIASILIRSCCGDDSLLNIYRKFAYKSETERLRIVAYDIFPTIAICEASVPKNAKLLIASFPYPGPFRIEYYLYPRSIYWYKQKTKDTNTIIEFCKRMDIPYFITYDGAKNPILGRVK